jgi:6-phosphogluconolactonase
MANYELSRFPGPTDLAQRAATLWLEELARAADSARNYCVALAGGRIAKDFCSAVARQAKEKAFDFARIHFFWSDERCVPPADPESNFRLAWDALLKPLAIPESQIHRIRGEEPPESAALGAERELRQLVCAERAGQPVCDLVFLGFGENGHVASLFPEEGDRMVQDPTVFRPVVATKPPPRRITMGYQTIVAAQQVWVLASGTGKEKALTDSLNPSGSTPLARVLGMRSSTRIFTDIPVS